MNAGERERERAGGGCGWRNVSEHRKKLRWPQFILGSVKLRVDCLSLSLCPAAQGVHRVRVLVPVRRPALYAPAAPTAPARPWSACGAAARSAASTPRPTSSPSPTDSVWSGRPRTVVVRRRGGWQTCTRLISGLWMCFHTNLESRTEQTLYWRSSSWSKLSFQTLKHKETQLKTEEFSVLSNASQLSIIYISSNGLNYYLQSGLTVVRYCLDEYLTPLLMITVFFLFFYLFVGILEKVLDLNKNKNFCFRANILNSKLNTSWCICSGKHGRSKQMFTRQILRVYVAFQTRTRRLNEYSSSFLSYRCFFFFTEFRIQWIVS